MMNRDRSEYHVIRPDTLDSLDNFVLSGWEPGGFLMAVLENNLMEAVGRADTQNGATLAHICSYVYNELPSDCHGSPEKVKRWLESFRIQPVAPSSDGN